MIIFSFGKKNKHVLMYFIQQCFICHSSGSPVSEDAEFERRTVSTTALAVTVRPPPPTPASECGAPPPQDPSGGETHSLAGEGAGGTQFRRKDRNSSTLCTYNPFTDGTQLLQGLECIRAPVSRVIMYTRLDLVIYH